MTLKEKRKLAKNPTTPIKVLITLSKDSEWEIRNQVALNPNTPPDILTTLSKDKHDYVKEVAFKRLEDLKDQIVDVATNDFNSL